MLRVHSLRFCLGVLVVAGFMVAASTSHAAELQDITGSWKATFMGKELILDVVQNEAETVDTFTMANLFGVVRVPYAGEQGLYHVTGAHMILDGKVYIYAGHVAQTDEGNRKSTSFTGKIEGNNIVGVVSQTVMNPETLEVLSEYGPVEVTLSRDTPSGSVPTNMTSIWEGSITGVSVVINMINDAPVTLQGQSIVPLHGTATVDFPMNSNVPYSNIMGFAQAGGRVFMIRLSYKDFGEGMVPIMRTFLGNISGSTINGSFQDNTGGGVDNITLTSNNASAAAIPSIINMLQ